MNFQEVTGRQTCMNIDGRMACVMLEMEVSAMQMVAFPVISYIGAMFAHAIEEIEDSSRRHYKIYRSSGKTFASGQDKSLT